MKTYDFLIIGAGIFGVCTAIELRKKNYSVAILNPDSIPHPLAASTDISKIIRMEYGSDVEYMDMAIESLDIWRTWNELLGEKIFHETGFLLTTSTPLEENRKSFDSASYFNLLQKGFTPERLNNETPGKRYSAFRNANYTDGFFHAKGGYAESGRAVELLANYARSLGVEIHEGQTAETLCPRNGKIERVTTKEGANFSVGQVIVCAGNFTHYLVPDLQPYFKVTGHPVFHIQPRQPELFTFPNFTVFAADISKTGWYGFPLHPKEGVVKIANHGIGLELHPGHDERIVTQENEQALRNFLKETLPDLANDPIVYTRLCCYTDTLDGHFWIDNHPEIKNLTVGSGGSGHGFKMGPIIGAMIATVAEGGSHKWSARYRWRELTKDTISQEEARSKS
ncbi:MAG: glycine/D-amino acid oxidase-like deaminating enzyme [Saprospiraceae bacterium]|jgi:glycine/D-amino acid oxidase-like deaminating enzyme